MDPLDPLELLDVRLPADDTDAEDSFVWTDDVDKILPMRMAMMIMTMLTTVTITMIEMISMKKKMFQ